VIYNLTDPAQAHALLSDLWPKIKASLSAGHRLTLEVKRETRSLQENAMLHALLTEISRKMEWAGNKHDVDTWKRLLVSAWGRARGDSVTMLPALDGQGIDIVYSKTSKLTVAECAELIEFVLAWAAQNGIELHVPEK
jgi:hypothetical protein